MRRDRLIGSSLVVFMVAAAWMSASWSAEGFHSFLGTAPPELVVSEQGWLIPPPAQRLADLRGRVVWIEFSYLACGGCIKMAPVLERWHRTYGDQGLVVLEVDHGEIDSREALQAHVEQSGLSHPLLWDQGGATADAFGVRRYPTAYLLAPDGRVVWEGNPARFDRPGDLDSFSSERIEELESLLRGYLAQVRP